MERDETRDFIIDRLSSLDSRPRGPHGYAVQTLPHSTPGIRQLTTQSAQSKQAFPFAPEACNCFRWRGESLPNPTPSAHRPDFTQLLSTGQAVSLCKWARFIYGDNLEILRRSR